MGGPGSGRWCRGETKDTVESCSGLGFTTRWSNRQGEVVASVGVRVQPGGVLLSYHVRLVAILYGVGRDFRCRHRARLSYESQRDARPMRLLAKAQQIRRRLGGSGRLIAPFPAKPKGMHWRTYDRLRWRARESEIASLCAMLASIERRAPS